MSERDHIEALKIVKQPSERQPVRWYEVSFSAATVEHEPLPIHETAVCPRCDWAGVTLRGDLCDCHRCDYRWRWPLVALDMGLD